MLLPFFSLRLAIFNLKIQHGVEGYNKPFCSNAIKWINIKRTGYPSTEHHVISFGIYL